MLLSHHALGPPCSVTLKRRFRLIDESLIGSLKILGLHANGLRLCLRFNGLVDAHAMTKRCIHQEWNMGIDEAIEAEAQAQAICMQTKDFERAYEAVVKKAKPMFQGN